MPRFLPRELGESGALRVADVYGDAPKPSKQNLQDWIRDEFGDQRPPGYNEKARELRAENMRRFMDFLLRPQRPARVS